MFKTEPQFTQRIRSFMRRQGRLTPGQQYALEHLWAHYVLDPQVTYDFDAVFGRAADMVVEIGFGNGESLLAMAMANPEVNYLGIEVHRPGVGHLLLQLHEHGLKNVRIYCHDAIEILEQHIENNSLKGIQLFFPDPWHKTRHHKRRIVNTCFVALVKRILKDNGYFHAATDWKDYAEQILTLFSAEPEFFNTNPQGGFCERPGDRPLTKFENRGKRLGHGVWDLIFRKNIRIQ